MRLIETTSHGIQYFVFEHSKFYQKIQFEFLEAVESLNPQNIAVCSFFHYYITNFGNLFEAHRC